MSRSALGPTSNRTPGAAEATAVTSLRGRSNTAEKKLLTATDEGARVAATMGNEGLRLHRELHLARRSAQRHPELLGPLGPCPEARG